METSFPGGRMIWKVIFLGHRLRKTATLGLVGDIGKMYAWNYYCISNSVDHGTQIKMGYNFLKVGN